MVRAGLITLFLFCCMAAPAFSTPVTTPDNEIPHINYPGMQKLKYRYGPLRLNPGQNSIKIDRTDLHPKVPGYIIRFESNLVRAANNKPLPADILHVHHGVWLFGTYPTIASGQEKSIPQLPKGFGLTVTGREPWSVAHMLHNLISAPETVYLTWDIDFVPLSAPAARKIKPVSVQWMDVAGRKPYPIFNALKGQGSRFIFPDDARGAERQNIGEAQSWRVDRDVTLVYSMSHMHPGGLYTDMYAQRGQKKRLLFRSRAKYFDDSSNSSWDMAITSTPENWRVRLRPGDLVSLHTTVDTSHSSWRESMGIMPAAVYNGHDIEGIDPFTSSRPIPQKGIFSHGRLPENSHPGGLASDMPDPRSLPDGPAVSGPVAIRGFRYQLGDLNSRGKLLEPPVVRAGQRISFVNLDATAKIPAERSAYHTVTTCKAPCNRTTGTSYPRADGPEDFDSGQLGFGPDQLTPSANRNVWSTPPGLTPGTYTFFCRVHPFMRGAFRVKSGSSPGVSAGWPVLPRGRGI